MGVQVGLEDAFHRPREPVIGMGEKAWVMQVACTKPKALGYAAELWTRQALAGHLRRRAEAAVHPSPARAAKATVQRILDEPHLQPHKGRYYLERHDPELERKVRAVLMIYQEVLVSNQPPGAVRVVMTVSIDEEPGVQVGEEGDSTRRAIGNTASDLPLIPGRHAAAGRDTMSISGTGCPPSWLHWIDTTGTRWRTWKNGIAAGNLLCCSRRRTSITRPI